MTNYSCFDVTVVTCSILYLGTISKQLSLNGSTCLVVSCNFVWLLNVYKFRIQSPFHRLKWDIFEPLTDDAAAAAYDNSYDDMTAQIVTKDCTFCSSLSLSRVSFDNAHLSDSLSLSLSLSSHYILSLSHSICLSLFLFFSLSLISISLSLSQSVVVFFFSLSLPLSQFILTLFLTLFLNKSV